MRTSKDYINLEAQYGAHNYHPLPVVLSHGKGVFVWDVEGKCYFDFLSAYSAVNQGHCHPRIVKALQEQSTKLTLTSRAFHNDQLGVFERYVSQTFGYDKLLPMNTGAEAVETAIKIARKWGYEKKKVAHGKAKIVVCDQNFHGRTTTIISFSSDPVASEGYAPYTEGFISVPYNNIDELSKVFSSDPNIVGFLVEPIQGEAGVVVPDSDYLDQVHRLCKQHNILWMADEIQTGIARTGHLLATCGDCTCIERHCEATPQFRPDIVILGKALGAGVFPVSAVLANDDVMDVITPGTHGSTFGGNPIASVVAIEALKVVKEEKLALKADHLGRFFREALENYAENSNILSKVRGKGLLNAIVINDTPDSDTAWQICMAFADKGLLAKPTHGNIIRFAPPLVITQEQLQQCIEIIITVLSEFE